MTSCIRTYSTMFHLKDWFQYKKHHFYKVKLPNLGLICYTRSNTDKVCGALTPTYVANDANTDCFSGQIGPTNLACTQLHDLH